MVSLITALGTTVAHSSGKFSKLFQFLILLYKLWNKHSFGKMYLLKNIRNYRFYYKFVIKSLIFNIFFLVNLPDVYIFHAGTALSPRLCLVPSVVLAYPCLYLLALVFTNLHFFVLLCTFLHYFALLFTNKYLAWFSTTLHSFALVSTSLH